MIERASADSAGPRSRLAGSVPASAQQDLPGHAPIALQAKPIADPEAGATLDADGFVVPQPGSVPNPGAHLRPEQNSQPSPDAQTVPVPQPNDTIPFVAPTLAPVTPAAQPIASSSALLNALTGTGPAPADLQAGTHAVQQAAQTTPDPNAALLGALTNTQIHQQTIGGDATLTVAIPAGQQGITPPASAGPKTGAGPTSSALLNALTGTGPVPADIQAGSQAIQQASQNSSDSNAALLGVLTNTQIQQQTTTTGDRATTLTAVTGPDGHTSISITQRPVPPSPSSPHTQNPTDPKAQATRDWVNEMWQLGLSATRFQTNLTGGGGWSGLTHSWSTLARGVTSFGQTWSGSNPQPRADALTDLGAAVIRWDDLKEHGPEYWQTKLGLDLGAGIALDGPTAALTRGAAAATDAAEKAAIQAGKDVGTAVDDAAAVAAGKDAGQQAVDNPTTVVNSDTPAALIQDDPPASGRPHPGDADRPDRRPPSNPAAESDLPAPTHAADGTTPAGHDTPPGTVRPDSADTAADTPSHSASLNAYIGAENEATQILGRTADRAVGIDEWATRHGPLTRPPQVHNSLNEVRELRRQLEISPESTGTPALDNASITPKHPITGGTLSEFDIGIMQPGHSEITRRVEVKTLRDPLENADRLNSPVKQAIEKVLKREEAGMPITTRKEVSVYVNIRIGSSSKKGIATNINAEGTITRTRLDGTEIGQPNNMFDEFEDLLNDNLKPRKSGVENSDKIDKVTIVNDANPGKILAEFARRDSGWKRTK
ncbi:hypothetical protein [Nocardia sp. NBC_01327]|uniref:hypothetical protein n=1 Tax=Nocardia sp. NBC_01327 TaxID=2903593 RepID=UPI002E13C15D|nr:hypothetical protein OG326_38930 [Nocardia sp. NBC_01327]